MHAGHPTALPRGLVLLGCWLLYVTGCRCQTTVPVFLPGYREIDWKVLRGSVVSSVGMNPSGGMGMRY